MQKYEGTSDNLLFLAEIYGWQLLLHNEQANLLYFRRGHTTLSIWYDTMTVRTTLIHPKLGSTSLYRKRVDAELIEALLDNPRTHTNKGFIKKV